MYRHRGFLCAISALGLGLACTVTEEAADGTQGPSGGKADDPSADALCPAAVALNAAEGSAKRCFDSSSGRFVATECCAALCAGAGIRHQSNGDRCAWLAEPGLPGAEQGQFAPSVCCALNDELSCGRGEGTRNGCEDSATGNAVADVCCGPVPNECHPAVSSSILNCVFEQGVSAADAGEPVPNLLARLHTCTTELEMIAGELDQRCAFSPDLPFCGLPFETIHEDFIQPCATIERDPYDCALGLTFSDTTAQSHIAVVANDSRTLAQAMELDATTQAQIVAAVSNNVGEALSLAEAFASVDDERVNLLRLFDLSNNRSYAVVEFGAGDNSFGAFFSAGTTEVVATINDGDIMRPDRSGMGCAAPIGAGGTLCSATSDCADGFTCTGRITVDNPIQNPLGLCVDTSFGPENNDPCTALDDCGPQGYCTGLVGMGGAGFCGARWMFGQRDNDGTLEAPDGGSVRSDVWVYGQATVPMDLQVTLSLFHDTDVGELQVELLIPGPSDGSDEDRARDLIWPAAGVSIDDLTGGQLVIPVRNFGDESINGAWTLLVTDTAANGSSGGAAGWQLNYSSRFD